jgi:type 1 fimbriae regulatory protein FimB
VCTLFSVILVASSRVARKASLGADLRRVTIFKTLNNSTKLFVKPVVYNSMAISSRNKRRREHLTQDEVDKLLAASKSGSRNPVRDYCILLLMFRHGLRVSELCSMKLTDINLDIKEFHVTRLKGCDSGPHELYNGESQAIRAWLTQRAKMNPPEDCDTLFISERRKPLSRCTVWLMITQVAEAAGLEYLSIHPHMLRHSCGYALVNKGTDIRIIQGYLGHRSISSTVRYTKLDSKRFAKLF